MQWLICIVRLLEKLAQFWFHVKILLFDWAWRGLKCHPCVLRFGFTGDFTEIQRRFLTGLKSWKKKWIAPHLTKNSANALKYHWSFHWSFTFSGVCCCVVSTEHVFHTWRSLTILQSCVGAWTRVWISKQCRKRGPCCQRLDWQEMARNQSAFERRSIPVKWHKFSGVISSLVNINT